MLEEGRTIDLRKAALGLYLLCISLLYRSSKSTAGSQGRICGLRAA